MKERFINWLINITKVDTNKISDGYHTFEELYEHRILLWLNVLRESAGAWMSYVHSDGTTWPGWFIAGVGTKKGKQMTYHIPEKYWNDFAKYTLIKRKAPKWDGHTPQEVLNRLKEL